VQTETFTDRIRGAMEERDISIRQLGISCDVSYETARRVYRGSIPAKPVLRLMCEVLDLNFDEMGRLANAATLIKKYGEIPLEVAGKNPELAPIERVWFLLTPDQKQDAISLIQAWAARSKANKTS